MNGIQSIQAALKSTAGLPGWYLSDLSDADLLKRPRPTPITLRGKWGI